jgi:hypothetical protein
METTTPTVKVADEAWIALALLHRENPRRQAFAGREIVDRAKAESAHSYFRPGVQVHVYLHNVANLPANSAPYRMFYRTAEGKYRLFRPDDNSHPSRTGKTKPERLELPEQYHGLLDWYEQTYCECRADQHARGEDDPFLRMRGAGKDIWEGVDADAFVDELRTGWDAMDSQTAEKPRRSEFIEAAPASQSAAKVWARLVQHQGEEFRTKKELPFKYEIDGSSGIWFFREGKKIPKRLWRGDLEKALAKAPIQRPSDIKECFDSSYLYGLLTDARILGSGR